MIGQCACEKCSRVERTRILLKGFMGIMFSTPEKKEVQGVEYKTTDSKFLEELGISGGELGES